MRKPDPIQFLPTVSWAAFYVAPMYLLHSRTADLVSAHQMFGAAFLLLALFIGDLIASRSRPLEVVSGVPPRLLLPLALVVIALPVAHILMSGEIPMLKIIAGHTTREAMPDREHFNKDIPRITSYLFQYVLSVFGPLLFGLFVASRRHGAAGLTLLWCAAYALTSGAKWPSLILVFTALLVVSAVRPGRWRVVLPVLTVACGIVFFVAADRLSTTMTDWAASSAAKTDIERLQRYGPVSVGDIHRIAEARNGPTRFGRTIDYLVYRVYLGPVEVASRWYAYFPSQYGRYLGFDGILWNTEDGRAPSNLVGAEVYQERFPDRYFDSTSAYASIDADAHAHWGIFGIIAAGLALLALRILMSVGSGTSLGKVSNAAQLAILTTVPFQGSIQAIAVSQGMLALLLIQLAMWQYTRSTTGTHQVTAVTT